MDVRRSGVGGCAFNQRVHFAGTDDLQRRQCSFLNVKASAGRRVGEGHEDGVLTLSAKSTPMVVL